MDDAKSWKTSFHLRCCSNINIAFDRAFTPGNIRSGFRSTGIFPYDRDIFDEADFLVSYVTDHPEVPGNAPDLLQALLWM